MVVVFVGWPTLGSVCHFFLTSLSYRSPEFRDLETYTLVVQKIRQEAPDLKLTFTEVFWRVEHQYLL